MKTFIVTFYVQSPPGRYGELAIHTEQVRALTAAQAIRQAPLPIVRDVFGRIVDDPTITVAATVSTGKGN